MDQQGKMILELWRMFLRHLKVLIGVTAIGVAISALVAYILPPVYVSEAKILVESQQIPTQLARSTITSDANERLSVIRQRLLTRDNLLNVIETQNLFQNRPDLSISERIELLRDATAFEPISLAQRGGRRGDTTITAFVISVRLSNAQQASAVANEFVTAALSQNLRARSERASETLDFFRKEEERLTGALQAVEAEITAFKRENESALPESREYRRSELTRLSEAQFELDQRLLEFEEARGALKRELDQLANAAETGVGGPLAAAQTSELRRLEAQLAQKRAVFSDSHREVRALRAQIAALQRTTPADPEQPAGGGAFDAQLQSLERQLKLVDTQMTLVTDQRAAMVERMEGLERSLQATPNVEMALNALNRRYAELQDQYELVVKKRAEAETGEKLEINQQAERFEVIENALVPEKPVSPNRRKILAMGSGLSLGLAVGLAFLLELLNPALRSAARMERQLDLRPVVTIPYIRTRRERRNLRLKWGALALLIFVGAPAFLYAVDTYYLPLQLVMERVIDQLGLAEIIQSIEERF